MDCTGFVGGAGLGVLKIGRGIDAPDPTEGGFLEEGEGKPGGGVMGGIVVMAGLDVGGGDVIGVGFAILMGEIGLGVIGEIPGAG